MGDILIGGTVEDPEVGSTVDGYPSCEYALTPANVMDPLVGAAVWYVIHPYEDNVQYDDDRGCEWGGQTPEDVFETVPICRDLGAGIWRPVELSDGLLLTTGVGEFVLAPDGAYWFDGALLYVPVGAAYDEPMTAVATALAMRSAD